MVSSLTAFGCTFLFFCGLVSRSGALNFLSCLLLSWAYVGVACVYAQYAKEERRAVAVCGVAIAIIYSVFTNLVYYTQLTTVAHQAADQSLLKVLTFEPGSWLFGFDILGYGLMALSTFLIGLTLEPKNARDRALKILLLLHGVFFPICVIAPLLGLFKAGGDDTAGVLGLMGWCIYFAPIMILSFLHFRVRSV